MAEEKKNNNYLYMASYCYGNQFATSGQTSDGEDRAERFKKRLEVFENIESIYDAKQALETDIPVKTARTSFSVGNAKVFILNTDNMVRISFSSPEEFIAYNFV